MPRIIGFLVLLLFLAVPTQAQLTPPIVSRTCGATHQRDKLIRRYPETKTHMENARKAAAAFAQNSQKARLTQPVIQIPVVFHVLYHTPEENITTAQILSQLEVLNEDYRHRNADSVKTLRPFKKLAADTQIQFCLAIVDPNGQPTTGITRTYTDSVSFDLEDNMKFSATGGKDAWNTKKYLNIWICNLGNQVLGYGQFPGSPANIDGVSLYYKAVGRFPANPNQNFAYNLGRTGTHEVGHWLGLEHIWGINFGCDDTDGIDDTPNQDDATTGCPTGTRISCNNASLGGDMYQNFMDYTDDACMNLFTRGQGTYMQAIINTARPGLLSSVVCANPLQADFSVSDSVIVTGSTVQFTDNSIGIRANSWKWDFGGGIANSTSIQNPTVTFPEPGKYTVTLTVSAGNISDTETKINYILVTPNEPVIYPNPARDMVTVVVPANLEVNSIMLLNSLGQSIRAGNAPGKELTINLAGLANGIYYVRIILHTGQVITRKLIVLK
ncbi:M43 family zinc metalloprotease [Adhaeribacter aquaticus]|uniref:M43 family zinc metalloprotease n=1 Tax=Adhaeribacter aquaticus TaxID=299567 RepID=UPI0003F81126|nr:M43 family zinc metalloprotease [Adhaeribacter aquaticus]